MIRPAVKSSLYQDVVNQIIEVVKKGEWKPGEKIPAENDLASKFQVSRNCIREALKALQLLGMFESLPGKGTFLTLDAVRKIQNTELVNLISDENYMDELLEMRMIVEVQTAFLASQRATDKDLEYLKEALDDLKNRINNPDNTSPEKRHDFHLAIAKISKNRFLFKFLESITDELAYQRSLVSNSETINYELQLQDHIEIFEAIKNREPEKARDAMYRHFIHASDALKK